MGGGGGVHPLPEVPASQQVGREQSSHGVSGSVGSLLVAPEVTK